MKPHPFYKTKAWQIARRQALHDAGYACRRCGADLSALGRSVHVHHRKPLLRAPALGIEPLNLKPLCVGCHDAEHHEIKGNGSVACDIEGRPLDPLHPWNKAT